MDKPPSNSPTDRGHSGVCAETVRLDDDGDAVTDEALDGRGLYKDVVTSSSGLKF